MVDKIKYWGGDYLHFKECFKAKKTDIQIWEIPQKIVFDYCHLTSLSLKIITKNDVFCPKFVSLIFE